MNGIRIVSTGRALPNKKVTNEDLSRIVETSDEWITSRTGIKSRYLSEQEKNYELATAAAKKAIERAGITAEEIGVIIVATITPDDITPGCACLVQRELNMSNDVMAFDLNAGCTGFLYGIKVCKGLLENSHKKYALLIGSEQLSRIVDYTDRATCVLFGDGAGAAILELSDNHLYHQKVWSEGNAEALVCKGAGNNHSYLFMDGSAVFKFAVNAIQEGIDQLLAETSMQFDDVDYILCHQANERIIDFVKRKYKGPEHKFFMNLQKYGNTSAASIPIAIDEMLEQGLIQSGSKVICVGFGAGFTWSSALLTF